jgi:hypothetical protein
MISRSYYLRSLIAGSRVAALMWPSVLIVVLASGAFSQFELRAQTAPQSQTEPSQLLFNFQPGLTSRAREESEFVSVAIAKNGSTQIVRYAEYQPSIIAVYEGSIPGADVARLFASAESIIPRASRISMPYIGSCDSDVFDLSLIQQNSSAIQTQEGFCLIVMPADIQGLVQELRVMWKRLRETPIAYGYVRTVRLSEDDLKSLDTKSTQFFSMQRVSPKLRVLLRKANGPAPRYYGLSKAQFAELASLAVGPLFLYFNGPMHFYVRDNGRVYSLALFESRNASSLENRKKNDGVELRFEFYPTQPRVERVSPIFMTVERYGGAHALRYSLSDPNRNVAAYEGTLPVAEVVQLLARVQVAFRLPKHRRDYDPKIVYETDSFYLALKDRTGELREMSGGLETRPEEIGVLINELIGLWKPLREVLPAYAYLASRPMEDDRLRSLRSEHKVNPTRIESLSSDLQSLLIPIVTQPHNYYPLTEAQYQQLQTVMRVLTYKRKGYELRVFLSTKESQ